MITPQQEDYVFKYLSWVDMDRVIKCIERIKRSRNKFTKEALYRDAVVSYARPFSGNRGVHTPKNLKLKKSRIPIEHKSTHKRIMVERNELFAHNDVSKQYPIVENSGSFTVKGYEKLFDKSFLPKLEKLATYMSNSLREEVFEMKKNGL